MPGNVGPVGRYGALGPGAIAGVRRETNLRELGGYAVAGGGVVRRGLLLRGPRLSDLSSCELSLLEGMGVRAVLDLRSSIEASSVPDPELAGASNVRVAGMYLPGTGEEVDFSPRQMDRLGIAVGDAVDEVAMRGLHDMLLSSYVGMPYGNPGLRALFDLLIQGGPVLFHCTSGKDRTGVAAMLVLLALGASREDAIFDFSLTNAYRADAIRRILRERSNVLRRHPELAPLAKLERGVDSDMADAVIDGILSRYGSYEAYFDEELGIGRDELARLRELYVARP